MASNDAPCVGDFRSETAYIRRGCAVVVHGAGVIALLVRSVHTQTKHCLVYGLRSIGLVLLDRVDNLFRRKSAPALAGF